MNQINTRGYSDYTTNDNYFCEHSPIQIASDMRLICASLFQSQYKQMTNIAIPLYKYSTDRYHLNILIMITIIYQIYIGSELYNLAHTKNQMMF